MSSNAHQHRMDEHVPAAVAAAASSSANPLSSSSVARPSPSVSELASGLARVDSHLREIGMVRSPSAIKEAMQRCQFDVERVVDWFLAEAEANEKRETTPTQAAAAAPASHHAAAAAATADEALCEEDVAMDLDLASSAMPPLESFHPKSHVHSHRAAPLSTAEEEVELRLAMDVSRKDDRNMAALEAAPITRQERAKAAAYSLPFVPPAASAAAAASPASRPIAHPAPPRSRGVASSAAAAAVVIDSDTSDDDAEMPPTVPFTSTPAPPPAYRPPGRRFDNPLFDHERGPQHSDSSVLPAAAYAPSSDAQTAARKKRAAEVALHNAPAAMAITAPPATKPHETSQGFLGLIAEQTSSIQKEVERDSVSRGDTGVQRFYVAAADNRIEDCGQLSDEYATLMQKSVSTAHTTGAAAARSSAPAHPASSKHSKDQPSKKRAHSPAIAGAATSAAAAASGQAKPAKVAKITKQTDGAKPPLAAADTAKTILEEESKQAEKKRKAKEPEADGAPAKRPRAASPAIPRSPIMGAPAPSASPSPSLTAATASPSPVLPLQSKSPVITGSKPPVATDGHRSKTSSHHHAKSPGLTGTRAPSPTTPSVVPSTLALAAASGSGTLAAGPRSPKLPLISMNPIVKLESAAVKLEPSPGGPATAARSATPTLRAATPSGATAAAADPQYDDDDDCEILDVKHSQADADAFLQWQQAQPQKKEQPDEGEQKDGGDSAGGGGDGDAGTKANGEADDEEEDGEDDEEDEGEDDEDAEEDPERAQAPRTEREVVDLDVDEPMEEAKDTAAATAADTSPAASAAAAAGSSSSSHQPSFRLRTFSSGPHRGGVMIEVRDSSDDEGGNSKPPSRGVSNAASAAAATAARPPSRNPSLSRASAAAAAVAFDAVSSLPSSSPPPSTSPVLPAHPARPPNPKLKHLTLTPFCPLFAHIESSNGGQVGPYTRKSMVALCLEDLIRRQAAIEDQLMLLDKQLGMAMDNNPHGLNLDKHIGKLESQTNKLNLESDHINDEIRDRESAEKQWWKKWKLWKAWKREREAEQEEAEEKEELEERKESDKDADGDVEMADAPAAGEGGAEGDVDLDDDSSSDSDDDSDDDLDSDISEDADACEDDSSPSHAVGLGLGSTPVIDFKGHRHLEESTEKLAKEWTVRMQGGVYDSEAAQKAWLKTTKEANESFKEPMNEEQQMRLNIDEAKRQRVVAAAAAATAAGHPNSAGPAASLHLPAAASSSPSMKGRAASPSIAIPTLPSITSATPAGAAAASAAAASSSASASGGPSSVVHVPPIRRKIAPTIVSAIVPAVAAAAATAAVPATAVLFASSPVATPAIVSPRGAGAHALPALLPQPPTSASSSTSAASLAARVPAAHSPTVVAANRTARQANPHAMPPLIPIKSEANAIAAHPGEKRPKSGKPPPEEVIEID